MAVPPGDHAVQVREDDGGLDLIEDGPLHLVLVDHAVLEDVRHEGDDRIPGGPPGGSVSAQPAGRRPHVPHPWPRILGACARMFG